MSVAAKILIAGLLLDGSGNHATIEMRSVMVTLADQVEVPARESGVLKSVEVREGDHVAAGDVVGGLEDRDMQLARHRAEIELETAAKKADNDVSVRFAVKSAEVARADLRRANESIELYKKSISQSELDELRLTAERTELEIEQAELNLETAGLERKLKRSELAIADERLARRQILAPLSGVVVEVLRKAGEWVEPGEMVMRIVRIDRLRVEGMLDFEMLRHDLSGSPVTLSAELPDGKTAQFAGRVVFVSPEVDDVNQEVRIVAEVENRDLLLRPGMSGTLLIHADAAR